MSKAGETEHGDGRRSAIHIARRFAGADPLPQAPRRGGAVRAHRANGCESPCRDCRSGCGWLSGDGGPRNAAMPSRRSVHLPAPNNRRGRLRPRSPGLRLRKKRQHRVRCVAEQRYAPFGPPLQWFAVVERPALGLGCRNNKLAQTTVPSLELAQKIRDFSVIRPRLCPTISGGGDGDKVHELPARDRVVDEMASRAEPKVCTGRRAISGASAAGTKQRKAQRPEKRG